MNGHVYKVCYEVGRGHDVCEVLIRADMPYLEDIKRAFYDRFRGERGDKRAKWITSIEYLGKIED